MADFVPESTPTPETQTIQAEALAEIAQIVMSLPEENRTVIKMLTSGYSQTEIAKILGKSKAVISRRASKAVKVLAESGLQDCFHN